MTTYCIIDRNEIPEDRAKARSVTCSREVRGRAKEAASRRQPQGMVYRLPQRSSARPRPLRSHHVQP